MANSPDLQMHDLICERDQLLKDLASRNSMLDRLTASNERLTAENDALKLKLQRVEAHREWLLEGYRKIAHGEPLSEQYARDTLSGPTDATIDRIIAVRAAKE